jgi:hypothetical protein
MMTESMYSLQLESLSIAEKGFFHSNIGLPDPAGPLLSLKYA